MSSGRRGMHRGTRSPTVRVMAMKSAFFNRIWRAGEHVQLWARWRTARRRLGVLVESLRYPSRPWVARTMFHVVSCQRNAGDAALKCLDSVYTQRYPRDCVRHWFVDDASDDGTAGLVKEWLASHPDHNVDYVRNTERKGGTLNTIEGFRGAPAGTVVVEINGDDWLPNPRVLPFLNRVYADRETWMTYNTLCRSDGAVYHGASPIPADMVRNNTYRDYGRWITSHLHTFRRELLGHVAELNLIDPETGDYWASADDLAIYLCLLELAGRHARHINRITYIYNYRDASHLNMERAATEAREQRIRTRPKHAPLKELTTL